MNISKMINKIQLFLCMSGVDVKITNNKTYDPENKRMRSLYGLFVGGRKIGYTRNQIKILEVLVLMLKDVQRVGGG